jgi:hypothetical protein
MFEFLFGKRPVCKKYKKVKPKPKRKKTKKTTISLNDIIKKSIVVAKQVADSGASPKEQAKVAGAVAADISESKGASPEQVLLASAAVASEVATITGANPEQAFEDACADVVEVLSEETGDIFFDASDVLEEMEAKGATPEQIKNVQNSVDTSKQMPVKEIVKKINDANKGSQWGYLVLNSVIGKAGKMIGPATKSFGFDVLKKTENTSFKFGCGCDKRMNSFGCGCGCDKRMSSFGWKHSKKLVSKSKNPVVHGVLVRTSRNKKM